MAKADTRAAILDVVLELLGGDDQRLTYDAVARRAGVSRQTVYSHFPTRATLLVAAVERAREVAGVEAASQAVFEAPTAREALAALVDLAIGFVPPVLDAYVAVERERVQDPDVEAAFAKRSAGRRPLANLVATRLQAEGDLAPPWTVATACELLATLTSGTTIAQFLRDMGWTAAQLHERLLVLLERTLLFPAPTEDR